MFYYIFHCFWHFSLVLHILLSKTYITTFFLIMSSNLFFAFKNPFSKPKGPHTPSWMHNPCTSPLGSLSDPPLAMQPWKNAKLRVKRPTRLLLLLHQPTLFYSKTQLRHLSVRGAAGSTTRYVRSEHASNPAMWTLKNIGGSFNKNYKSCWAMGEIFRIRGN